jgi:hypothetical protein
MKQKIKKVKVLAKRYKSEVDSSCLYETEVKLVRAEENNGDITYTVLILNCPKLQTILCPPVSKWINCGTFLPWHTTQQ